MDKNHYPSCEFEKVWQKRSLLKASKQTLNVTPIFFVLSDKVLLIIHETIIIRDNKRKGREMKMFFKQKTKPDILCSIAKYCKFICILQQCSVFQSRLYQHTRPRLITQEIYNPLVKKLSTIELKCSHESKGRQSSDFLHLLTFSDATSTKEKTEKVLLTLFKVSTYIFIDFKQAERKERNTKVYEH